MLSYFLLCLLSLQAAWSQPLHSQIDPSSHIVIVTPQAQVHLEPALRYLHGLSPLARLATPHHEETIVYVPAGAAASVLPVDVVGSGRSNDISLLKQGQPNDQIIQGIQQAQAQIVNTISSSGEALSEAGSSAAAAAASASAGLFPGFSPPLKQNDKLKATERIDFIETPANTLPLLSASEARQFYSVSPIYQPHAVELVRAPLYLAPLSAIRARSIQQPELAIQLKSDAIAPVPAPPELLAAPIPAANSAAAAAAGPIASNAGAAAGPAAVVDAALKQNQPEVLPLKIALKEQPSEQKLKELPDPAKANIAIAAAAASAASASAELEPEKKAADIARFLEANALKPEPLKAEEQSALKKEPSKISELGGSNAYAEPKPQSEPVPERLTDEQ